jgi:DNA-binding NarL/FixJ family response regulator
VRDLGTRAGELGAVGLFSKPFDLDDLLDAIRKVMGAQRSGAY